MWIKRTFEELFAENSTVLDLFPVWLITGPRQVGKSSLLLHSANINSTKENRQYINLDELDVRTRANQDPVFFARDITLPVTIDEIQYAAPLLSQIKVMVDKGVPAGSVWLSGSQSFEVMKGIQESLAGRVAVLNLFGLSDEEKKLKITTPLQYFNSIVSSTFPKLLNVNDQTARDLYLASYIKTYVERDIRELLGIQKRREFEVFLKICALRTGQVINYDDIARDCGVSPVTVKEWLAVLEDSFLIKLIAPFYSNKTKRLIKNPKLYFLDMGLCAHLAGWPSAENLIHSPFSGAAFETHILGNIVRYFAHRAKQANIYFWRTRDKQEIDFLVEHNGKVFPIEVKKGLPNSNELLSIKNIKDETWQLGTVITLTQMDKQVVALTEEWRAFGPEQMVKIFEEN